MIPLRIVLAAAFVGILCVAAGDLLFHALTLKLRRLERLFLAFITGAALVSTLMFGLAACQIAYTTVIVLAGLAVVGAWLWFCRPAFRNIRGLAPGRPGIWPIAFWAPLLIYACLYFLTALAPETDPDGPVYHVGLIARYYEHRGFFPIYTIFAGLGQGIEMLFWIGFAIGKHSAASMVEMLFLIAAPFGMYSLGERMGNPRAGVVGGLLFYLAPVVGMAGTIPYVDVSTAAVVFGVFCMLQIWVEQRDNRLLAIVGLLAGFCFACKLTASVAAIYAVLLALVFAWKTSDLRAGLRAAGIVALFALLTAAPWAVKDTIYYRNPFFPFFNSWFPNPYEYEMVEVELRHDVAHSGDVSYRDMPYELTTGGRLPGTIGPIFLLSPLALLSLRRRAGRQLLIAFVTVALPFFTNTAARFFLPALPFLAMAFALALCEIPAIGGAAALAAIAFHAYSSWPGVLDRWTHRVQWRIPPVNIAADFRIVPENEYLEENWRDYSAGMLLDRYVPAGDLVFSPSMGQLAYHHRRIIGTTFESSLARRAWNTLLSPLAPYHSNSWRRVIRFAPVSTARLRLQVAANFGNELRISELRFFDGPTEIVRSRQWKLTSSSNPWEIQLAFDNDFWSWWTSGKTVDPGTWIEVNFPNSLTIDRLTVDQIEDQRWIQLRAAIPVNGKWNVLSSSETATLSPPAPNFRMALSDEFKSMGISWILISDQSTEGADLLTRSPQWGLQRIAAINGYSLYRIR